MQLFEGGVMRTVFFVVIAVAAWVVPGAATACECCEHHHEHASVHQAPAVTAQLAPGEVRVKVPVTGMHCGHCAERIETALVAVQGVKSASVSFDGGVAIVVYEKSKVAPSRLVDTINGLGFKAGPPVEN
jgi:copper chaperone CopZ